MPRLPDPRTGRPRSVFGVLRLERAGSIRPAAVPPLRRGAIDTAQPTPDDFRCPEEELIDSRNYVVASRALVVRRRVTGRIAARGILALCLSQWSRERARGRRPRPTVAGAAAPSRSSRQTASGSNSSAVGRGDTICRSEVVRKCPSGGRHRLELSVSRTTTHSTVRGGEAGAAVRRIPAVEPLPGGARSERVDRCLAQRGRDGVRAIHPRHQQRPRRRWVRVGRLRDAQSFRSGRPRQRRSPRAK
jgi:hypothetical protein